MPHLPLWSLALSAAALLLVAALGFAGLRRRVSTAKLPADWALTARPVFSLEERRLYRLLRTALPHHVVLSKLPLVRFCQPTQPGQVRYWYRLLGTGHVTFAVCSPNGRVLAAIDLEGERASTSRAQLIKHSVLNACRVRHLRCSPDEMPSLAELQALLPMPELTPKMATVPLPLPMMQSSERLSSTVASRRQERANLWQDSTFTDSRYSTLLPLPETSEGADHAAGVSRPAPLQH